MKDTLLPILRCPVSGKPLRLAEGTGHDPESGRPETGDGRHRYEVSGGIPRFVPASNYAENFGMQWNHFARTQLDSQSSHAISAERFWEATGWKPADLAGRWVLDIGCGAGQFAEIALSCSANVAALDYTSAVDACLANLCQHPRLQVVQGDAFALPCPSRRAASTSSIRSLCCSTRPTRRARLHRCPPCWRQAAASALTTTRNQSARSFIPSTWCVR
jgi:uncharacterized protein YbaR (Trm112 family)